ncbi:MAG: DUF5668 domain-containing protein [Anaerolineales bacterium]|nr:DUF5668 domain-containing protein [Anaerolineales bacterium]
MENNNLLNEKPVQRRRSRSFFWPIILISVGVLLLLSNLGIVPWTTWNLLWRFWPLILVAVGIDVLIGQRSAVGSVISAFLILALIATAAGVVFFAEQLPFLAEYVQETPWQTAHVEQALEDFESASILIDWTSQPGSIQALKKSENLIEGDLTYQGELIFDVQSQNSKADIRLDTRLIENWGFTPFQNNTNAEWDISLTPEILLDLVLDTGSGSCEFDLSELTLEELYLDSGSGSISLSLPEDQSFSFTMDSGSGSVKIDIPTGTGIRVELDSGSGSFNPGGNFELVSGEQNGDGVWETKNYENSRFQIEMGIDQGSGSITFR